MDAKTLRRRRKGIEWKDIEFKRAQRAVPKSAFETVSASANTHGGWLIFGVSQEKEGFQVTGVDDPDKVQNDFLSVLHADGKINHDLEFFYHWGYLLRDGTGFIPAHGAVMLFGSSLAVYLTSSTGAL